MTTVNIRTQNAQLNKVHIPDSSKIRKKPGRDDVSYHKNKIPLAPGQNRSRTESMSSYHSGRSLSAKSAAKSTSVLSRRSSASSKNSKTSASNTNLSSSPRFLPWAFSNVSTNLIPDKYEIADYSQSQLINKQQSSDEGSTINNGSESSSNGFGLGFYQNGVGNHADVDYNDPYTESTFIASAGNVYDQPLPMETIHSQLPTIFDKDSSNTFKVQSKTHVMNNWKKKNKPPLHKKFDHHHSRSHSADFIDVLQQQTLQKITKPLSSQGTDGIINSLSDESIDRHNFQVLSPPTDVDSNADSFINEKEILLRHDTEPIYMAYHQYGQYGAMNVSGTQYRKYDLGRYDLYKEVETSASGKFGSLVSLLDGRSATEGGGGSGSGAYHQERTFKRRLFLVLTQPQTSRLSAGFFALYFLLVLGSVTVMMMQTMSYFQFTPEKCDYCHNASADTMNATSTYDTFYSNKNNAPTYYECQCPPVPINKLIQIEDYMIYFFSIEWFLRVLSYEPLKIEQQNHITFWQFLFAPYTVLDFLATFPYYLIRFHQIEGMGALRLLRFFRIFQLVRLKQYDMYLTTMFRVMVGSIQAIHIYLMTLLFLAAVFGSVIFWFEKGEWKYTDLLEEPGYAFIRVGADGITEELSPFHSIPGSFWWFFVTATTAGYGDAYPTSTPGKFVAVFALLCGVLVIAFPVSIFSELWSNELEEMKRQYRELNGDDDDIADDFSYQSSDGQQAPVKFVSTTSAYHQNESSKQLQLDTSMSFTSMVRHDNATLSTSSVIQTGIINKGDSQSDDISDDGSFASNHNFTAKDVSDLRQYVETIEDSQKQIRKILAKLDRSM